MSTVITPFQGADPFSTATFNNRISQINTGFSYISNPNLLDNWYFGNPVDQRGGYISLQGVPVYNDAACTSLMGNQAETAATCIKSDTNYQRIINGQGAGYVKAADVVRGYVGAGYTVDRWKLVESAHVVTIEAGSITLRKPANTADFVYAQYFEGATLEFLRGKTATISVMDSNGNVYSKTLLIPVSGMFDSDNLYIGDNWWIDLIVLPSGDFYIRFVSITKAETTLGIQAAKLELGPQQTLAHQDADGNWVLNEVPDYGEQLRRCQRYFVRINNVYASGQVASNNTSFVDFAMPVPLRTNPVLTVRSKGALSSDGIIIAPSKIELAAREENHIYLAVTTSPLTTNQPACLHDASIDFSADV